MKSRAREFAIKAHGEQKYGDFPYSIHLDEVAKIVAPYGETAVMIAFLHDVVEDTAITEEDIKNEFGTLVARCVSILSDEPGNTRKIRKVATYRKMALTGGNESLALLVKAADRLANMRACIRSSDPSFLDRYKSEYKDFRQAVYRPHLCDDIWHEIDTIQSK